MSINKFIRNAEASNSITKIINRSSFAEMKEEIQKTYDYVYLPCLEIYKEIDIDKKGVKKAILQANYGIAETGTIIFISFAENRRRASMLAEHLLFVLEKKNILESLDDASIILENEFVGKSNYISFITGPSRTADIENQLIIGVHGPLTQEVLIID
jgi:L-lactate dehydrogenase complex protein LldG